jgi:transposase
VSKAIEANYREILMFPPAVEDWVGADHPARFLREVVERMDLEALGFRQSVGEEGRPHYGNKLQLKVWLWGYLNRTRSSRQLERACRENISLIWLTGGREPDHNTLWRFWRRNQQGIRQLFAEVVGVAVRAEVVGMVLHALDGTKIRAVASLEGALNCKRLEKDLKGLDEWIDELEREIQENEERESGSYRLPKELEDRKELRRRIDEALGKLKREKASSMNPAEPEARVMPCEGKKRFAYNAQAVVDEASGMIVAEEVVSESCDQRQLAGMLEKTRANLGKTAEDTVADKGYRSQEQIGRVAEQGDSVLVRVWKTEGKQADAYHVSRFRYEEEKDCWVCPQGEELVYEGTTRQRRGEDFKSRIYRCHKGSQCAVSKQCSRERRGRKVRMSPYYRAMAEQRRRQKDPAELAKLGKRKLIVERAFAEIKEHLGFRRWNYRGLEAVRTEWAFVATAYNLRKLLRRWQTGQLTLGA